jgi:6-phosphogluconate dehydrogenase (decarboxylating)
LQKYGVHYVDVGTSGGVAGLERGYCLIEKAIVQHLDPVLVTLAPGVGTAPRTPGRHMPDATAEQGYLHCGPHGAGHFVKMVHNGIEYGPMAAYAEGLNILRSANVGKRAHDSDAETAPMRNPEYYQYGLDLAEIAEVWRRGSVVASWLLDLMAAALVEDAELAGFSGCVSDSGEWRWTALATIDEGVPTLVTSGALFERFALRRAAIPIMPTGFCPRCESNLADMMRRKRVAYMGDTYSRTTSADALVLFGVTGDLDRHGIVTRGAGLLPPNHYLSVSSTTCSRIGQSGDHKRR